MVGWRDSMNAEQLQAIKERAQYATEGPWQVVESEESGVQIGTTWEHGQLKSCVPVVTTACGVGNTTVYINHVDAEFIAHARQDVPSLIAEVERRQKHLALSRRCYSIMEKAAFRLQDKVDALELAEAKARMENERLRGALEKIAYTTSFKELCNVEAYAALILEDEQNAI